MSQPQYLVIGRVARPHGVRGELRVQALTQFPERMSRLETVYVGTEPDNPDTFQLQTVERIRPGKDGFWLLKLEGINDRDEAEPWRGQYLLVSLADAVPLESDEVYLFQVMGLQVQTVDGEALGIVKDIIETGANDVYVVQGETYGEVLLPAIDEVIVSIDPDAGRMTVRLLPGLLPE